VKPPVSTNYKMVDGHMKGPGSAAQRGIQPVVYVSAKGTQPGEAAMPDSTRQNVILTALVLLILIALWMFGLLEVEPAVLY
jgi:hypothetical protein